MMDNIRFTKDHEWISRENDVAVIGITVHAQQSLGDIVFVELPAIGRKVKQGEACAVVESVKAASDIYAPVSGEIVAVNDAIIDDPAKVNQDAEGGGWFFKIRCNDGTITEELDGLLDRFGYENYLVQC